MNTMQTVWFCYLTRSPVGPGDPIFPSTPLVPWWKKMDSKMKCMKQKEDCYLLRTPELVSCTYLYLKVCSYLAAS